jgi:hypothetical protein
VHECLHLTPEQYRARLVSLLLFVTLSIPGGTNLCGIPIAYHSGTAVQASCGVFAGYFRQRPSPIFLPKFGVFEQGAGRRERTHACACIWYHTLGCWLQSDYSTRLQAAPRICASSWIFVHQRPALSCLIPSAALSFGLRYILLILSSRGCTCAVLLLRCEVRCEVHAVLSLRCAPCFLPLSQRGGDTLVCFPPSLVGSELR